MTRQAANLPNLYWVTTAFAIFGCAAFAFTHHLKSAAGFGLGSVGSLINLWLWHWLACAMEPLPNRKKGTWEASLFIGRYLILLAVGYVIVKALGVPALTVVIGLFTSTAAALASLIFEIIQGFRGKQSTG